MGTKVVQKMTKENIYIFVHFIYKCKCVITVFSSCSPDDDIVCMVWQVMEWYSSASVSVGNMFQDLLQLRETADNTECSIYNMIFV
jgi:hypothetical protein